MAPELALTTGGIVLVWGTIARSLILSYSFPPKTRHWIHFGLGTCYEIMWSCLYALAVYAVSLASATVGAALGFVLVVGVLIFYFIDYRYFLVFQTHLPFSTKEYTQELKSLRSSIWGVIFTWNFLFLVLAPAALAGYLLFADGASSAGPAPGSWVADALWMGGYFVVGLIANTISNSYVTKNLHDPLQYTPLQYFFKTRRLEFPEPARVDADLLARLGVEEPAYPFLRERDFRADPVPAGPLAALCEGARRLGGTPNIVFILLESFRTGEIGTYGGPAELTPCFDGLAREGILWRNFFANSFQTRHALLASYCSTLPNYGPSVMRFYPELKLRSLPAVLRERGYATAWIHNGDADFDRMRQFLTRNGVERIWDEYDFPLFTERLGWGISDEELMVKAVREMSALPQPFFLSLLTMSNHHPYEVPRRFRLHKGQGEYGRYLDAVHYTDFALGRFFALARQEPFFRNTISFVLADSSNRQPLPRPVRTLRDLLALGHQIPLLIHAPWLEQGGEVEAPASQVDLAPTVLELLGFRGWLPWAGRPLLSGQGEPSALVHKPGQYMGLVLPEGAAIREGGRWRWEGTPPGEARLQRVEDLLLLNRWAVENDRFVP